MIEESADVLYQLCVLWAECNIRPEDVRAEMDRRERLYGIAEKLDYIKSLGVTAVWLNPIYSSPNWRPSSTTSPIANPAAIAANYVMLHKQPKSAWTHELDLRPWGEKW
mgnify:CR=1 FL=1